MRVVGCRMMVGFKVVVRWVVLVGTPFGKQAITGLFH